MIAVNASDAFSTAIFSPPRGMNRPKSLSSIARPPRRSAPSGGGSFVLIDGRLQRSARRFPPLRLRLRHAGDRDQVVAGAIEVKSDQPTELRAKHEAFSFVVLG